jgi:hypothetical protein
MPHLCRAAALTCLLLVASGCSPCPFVIVLRLELGPRSVPCCGQPEFQEVVIPDQPDLAVDLAQTATPGRVGGQDAWLTTADCTQLFDEPYPQPGTGPRPTPRCQVILGPVSPGMVSPRAEVAPGRYRVFIQPYASNPGATDYLVDVGVWGRSCTRSPLNP